MGRKVVTNEMLRENKAHTDMLIKKSQLTEQANAIFTIAGHGMEPMYRDGEQVFVQYCDRIAVGEVGIFEFPDIGPVIRYKAASGLHRINPDCEDTVLDDRGALVYGKVLGRVTPDMIPTPEEERLYREYEKYPGNGDRA